MQSLQQLHKARLAVGTKDENKNVAVVLLGGEEIQGVDEELEGEATEAKVLSALEQKYDAIRDKLLIEVHIICYCIQNGQAKVKWQKGLLSKKSSQAIYCYSTSECNVIPLWTPSEFTMYWQNLLCRCTFMG